MINRKHLLKKINQNQIKNSKVDYNKEFLNKKLKDIFSDDISTKYSNNYYREYNKDLIEELLNLEDEEKKNLFENIFNLTFIDCMEHLCGKKYFKELEGLKSLDEIFQKQNEIFECIKDLVFNLEERINRKHSRNRKK